MQRSTLTLLSSLALAGLVAFATSGCAPESNDSPAPGNSTETVAPTTEPDNDDSPAGGGDTPSGASTAGVAEFTYGDTIYSSDLQFCLLNDSEDALFHGVAVDESGAEVGYLDGDFGILEGSAFGEVRIDFGSTGQFQSSDTFIAMGDAASNIVIVSFSDTKWGVIGGAWDQDGTQTSSSTLTVNC